MNFGGQNVKAEIQHSLQILSEGLKIMQLLADMKSIMR